MALNHKVAVGLLLLGVMTPVAHAGERSFDAGSRVFVSSAEPALELTIPDDFVYLGEITFNLGERASGERQIFARLAGARVEALVILQFEGLLPGIEGEYSFSIPPEERLAGSNYRFSPRPVRLGAHDWVHNTWAFDNDAGAREKPGYESDLTARLMVDRGLQLPSELIMSRFVRAAGDDSRREVILFYMEPLAAYGFSLADFPDGGPASPTYDRMSSQVREASLKIFRTLVEPTAP